MSPARLRRNRVYVDLLSRAESLGAPAVVGVVGAIYDRRAGNIVACLPTHGLGDPGGKAGLHFGYVTRHFLVTCKPREDLPPDPELPDEPVEILAADPQAARMLAEARVCGRGRVRGMVEKVVRFRRVKG